MTILRAERTAKRAEIAAGKRTCTKCGETKELEEFYPKPDKPKGSRVSDEALWLWGRLRNFNRNGLLDQDPNEVCVTMIPLGCF